MIAVTGANGNLGRLVLKGLLKSVLAEKIVSVVRSPAKAADLLELGVQLREADYDRPETLFKAFEGVEKVLLISTVVPGTRFRQHRAVIDAAKQVGAKFIAYTSMLRADSSSLTLAEELKETEMYPENSGLDFVVLRNGWYLENSTGGLASALAYGAIIGSAGEGRFAPASRADYALCHQLPAYTRWSLPTPHLDVRLTATFRKPLRILQ